MYIWRMKLALSQRICWPRTNVITVRCWRRPNVTPRETLAQSQHQHQRNRFLQRIRWGRHATRPPSDSRVAGENPTPGPFPKSTMPAPTPIERWKADHPAAKLANRFGLHKAKDGTFKGPCPVCGGDDRFTLWPPEKSRTGAVQGQCRSGCGRTGDSFSWAMMAANLDPANTNDVREFLRREKCATSIETAHRSHRKSAHQPVTKTHSIRRAHPSPQPMPPATRRLLERMPAERRESILAKFPHWRADLNASEVAEMPAPVNSDPNFAPENGRESVTANPSEHTGLIDLLNAAGLLHPQGRIETTADGRRIWRHPDDTGPFG